MTTLPLLAAALVLPLIATATGISETSIQTSTRSGGSLVELPVSVGSPFYFSITAASTDLVTFTASDGRRFSFTLGQLAGPKPSPYIPWDLERPAQPLADGRTRLFCVIPLSNIPFVRTGATVAVTRGAALLDRDPVVVR